MDWCSCAIVICLSVIAEPAQAWVMAPQIHQWGSCPQKLELYLYVPLYLFRPLLLHRPLYLDGSLYFYLTLLYLYRAFHYPFASVGPRLAGSEVVCAGSEIQEQLFDRKDLIVNWLAAAVSADAACLHTYHSVCYSSLQGLTYCFAGTRHKFFVYFRYSSATWCLDAGTST